MVFYEKYSIMEQDLNIKKLTKKDFKELEQTINLNYEKKEYNVYNIINLSIEEITISTIIDLISFAIYINRNAESHNKLLYIKKITNLNSSDLVENSLNSTEVEKLYKHLKSKGGQLKEYLDYCKTNIKELIKNSNGEISHLDFIYEVNRFVNRVRFNIENNNEYIQKIERVQNKEPVNPTSISTNQIRTDKKLVSLSDFYRNCFSDIGLILENFRGINPKPSFQRKLVWDLERKKNLIISIYNQIPISAFYVNKFPFDIVRTENPAQGYSSLLWDGQQRMHAIKDFLEDGFPVPVKMETEEGCITKEIYFSQCKSFFWRAFEEYNLDVNVTYFSKIEDVIEAYITINKAGVKHLTSDFEEALLYKETIKK